MAMGFEAYRANGSTLVSSTDGVARLIYSADLAEDYSGTINVPAFDSNLGYYGVRFYPYLNNRQGGQGFPPRPEDQSWTYSDFLVVCICRSYVPTLSWNNTTKNLTVTANSDPEDPYYQLVRYRYRLFMVHYK